jgi:hypothetical protein
MTQQLSCVLTLERWCRLAIPQCILKTDTDRWGEMERASNLQRCVGVVRVHERESAEVEMDALGVGEGNRWEVSYPHTTAHVVESCSKTPSIAEILDLALYALIHQTLTDR